MKISLFLLWGLLLSGAGLPCAIGTEARQDRAPKSEAVQVKSVSGRITSIQGNTFTVESERRDQTKNDQNSRMTFTLDQATTVQGKLDVGANADVTFREQAGNKIAVSIRVVGSDRARNSSPR
jgi:hypothetical protein